MAAISLSADVYKRQDIACALGVQQGMEKVLEDTFAEIVRQKSPDFAASRGEYLNAFLLARYLGWDFIDAKDFVKMCIRDSSTVMRATSRAVV